MFVKAVLLSVLVSTLAFAGSGKDVYQKSGLLKPVSRINTTSAEIAAYNPQHRMLFVVGEANLMDQVDLSDANRPQLKKPFLLDGEATSVTAHGSLIAVSLLAELAWEAGSVEIMKYEGQVEKLTTVKVCSHPDMITFTPDGKKLLVACEGEPAEDGSVDPLGGVAILDVEKDAAHPAVEILSFDDATIEPEYITVSGDSKIAWVSLQENNALARIDIDARKIDRIFDLGYVDHSKKGFGLDAKKDGEIRIVNENMWGLRQPDGIKTFAVGKNHFVLTANEGANVPDLEKVYGLKGIREKARRSGASIRLGSRSVSLFDGSSGKLLWDSGELFERTFAEVAPQLFNWNSKKGKLKADSRSDDKGSEPENVVIGNVKGRRLAFVGLERMSGVVVLDITDVTQPKLLDYYLDVNDRGPEGILFLDEAHSPVKGTPLLVVSYEYSKSLVLYAVELK